MDTPSSGCATATPALLLSGTTLTPSAAGQGGVAHHLVTRASMAAHVSGGGEPADAEEPPLVPRRALLVASSTVAHPSGAAGGSGRSPSGRGQASGVMSLAITAPSAMPARSTDGWGKRPSPRVEPSAK